MRNFFIALLSIFVEAQNDPTDGIENPSFRSLKHLKLPGPFLNEMSSWYDKCLDDPNCVIVYAFCKMQTNPAYPTTNPYGKFQMWEFGEISPLFLWGGAYNLPYPGLYNYGMSINEDSWNHKDCCSSGGHLKATGEIHAQPTSTSTVHHTGALD